MAPQLAKRLGTNVIVENKGGAAGVIGSDAVAKAPPDGSHLLLTSSTFLTTAATQAKLPYDPLAAFIPVAMVAEGPLLVAVPGRAADQVHRRPGRRRAREARRSELRHRRRRLARPPRDRAAERRGEHPDDPRAL